MVLLSLRPLSRDIQLIGNQTDPKLLLQCTATVHVLEETQAARAVVEEGRKLGRPCV